MNRCDSKFRGFTLIELLVVIAIISLLVSILLPSLQTARDLAKSTLCMTNLKQLGISFNFYGNDANGYFPSTDFSAWGEDVNTTNWPLRFYQNEYMADNNVFLCPAGKETLNIDSYHNCVIKPYNYRFRYIHYGYNYRYLGCNYYESGSYVTPPANAVDIAQPAETLLLADSVSGLLTNSVPFGWYTLKPTEYGDGYEEVRDAHNGLSANILWSDGHVSNMKDAKDVLQDGSRTYFDRK